MYKGSSSIFYRNTLKRNKYPILRRFPVRKFHHNIDFGKASADYAQHRHGLPKQFFEELAREKILIPNTEILDIGTGTGDIARNFAKLGCKVTAIDPSVAMIEQAKQLDGNCNLQINYRVGTAEDIQLPSHHFDAVTAVQAYHWFNSSLALKEIARVLKYNGQFVIASYDWKSKTGASWITESTIRNYNPNWKEIDFYNQPKKDLHEMGFSNIRVTEFMHKEHYSLEGWIGRASTSYGIGPSLSVEKVSSFKKELQARLVASFPGQRLEIWHRCYMICAYSPSFFSHQNQKKVKQESVTVSKTDPNLFIRQFKM